MSPEQRISAFVSLGQRLAVQIREKNADFVSVCRRAGLKNPWFTYDNVLCAMNQMVDHLNESELKNLSHRLGSATKPRKIALIADDIYPCSCFTDALCILLSGNILLLRPAEKDTLLLLYVFEQLLAIEPLFKSSIAIHTAIVPSFDAIVAWADDKTRTAYFSRYPHVFHTKKTSVAVLNGTESDDDLALLGRDIFYFFGRRSRNVSKIYMPESFDERRILAALEPFSDVTQHTMYMNNYEYQKSLCLIARQQHLDNGFLILQEDTRIKSPVSVVFYEKYSDFSQVQTQLENLSDEIHYVVASNAVNSMNTIPFGFQSVSEIQEDIVTFIQQGYDI